MDDIKKQIGLNIRRIRKSRGLKQSTLAELVGVEDKTISRIEVGGNYPSMDLLVRLSKVLECDLTDMVRSSDAFANSVLSLSPEEIKVLKKVLHQLFIVLK